MVANILPADPNLLPPTMTPGDRVKSQILTFSEHGHVAFQIKGNPVRRSPTPLPPQGWKLALVRSFLQVP